MTNEYHDIEQSERRIHNYRLNEKKYQETWDQLKDQWKQEHITLPEFAEKYFSTTNEALRKWVKGDNRCPAYQIIKLAKIVNKSPKEILHPDEIKSWDDNKEDCSIEIHKKKSTPLPTDALETVKKIIRAAGEEVMKYYGHIEPEEEDFKDTVEVVSIGDLASERLIIDRLSDRFPNHLIISEEQEKIEEWKNLPTEEEWVWYVDPLDGTDNYTRCDPNFAISIGLVRNGKPYMGVVYYPINKFLFTAAPSLPNGEARLNGEIIKPRDPARHLGQAIIATDWPWSDELRDHTATFINKIYPKVQRLKIKGSAVSSLCDLAQGILDAYVCFGLYPWDIAAASVIVSEARMNLFDKDGHPWKFSTKPFQTVVACAPPFTNPIQQFVAQVKFEQ